MKDALKKPWVIHPFLFAIYPILFIVAHNNIERVSFSEALLPLSIALGSSALLLLILGFVFKNFKKAGILTSILLVLFFSYGHVYELTSDLKIGTFSFNKHGYLLLVWAILLFLGAFFTIRTRKDLKPLTSILNIVVVVLVSVSLLNIGIFKFTNRSAEANKKRSVRVQGASTAKSENKSKPRDIYYIILDGYASEITLREVYNYDNREFLDYLTEKGFYIAPKSRSNYATTFLSMASSLNMEYVNHLSKSVGLKSKDRKVPYQMIKDNKVMNVLRSKGYKFIHFSSGWRVTDSNRYADLDIKCGKGNDFLSLLVQTTILDAFEVNLFKDDARKRVLETFSKMGDINEIKGPKFVFVHMIPPHAPYLFGANGEPVKGAKFKKMGKGWLQKSHYRNQLTFVNKKLKALIDEILKESEEPPIIILQADHGTAAQISEDHHRGNNNPTKAMLEERMGIFNAYYLPEDGNELLYDSITPVNTFRIIFNHYFDTDYKLLNDQIYFSNYSYPYKFRDITDIVKD